MPVDINNCSTILKFKISGKQNIVKARLHVERNVIRRVIKIIS